MEFLLAVIEREIDRIRHNRAYQFLLFWGPMLGILLMYLIFQEGAIRDLPIAVVDQDKSALSVKIKNAVDATQDVQVAYEADDIVQAQQLLEQGDIYGFVLIPSGTEKSVYKDIAAPIPVYINGTNVIVSSLVQRAALTAVKTYSAGVQMKKLMAQGMTEKDAMGRILPVSVEKHILFNPYTNYSYFLGSALVYVMLFLFVLLSATYTLGNELKRGTGESLLAASNGSVRLAVLGKLIPYTLIFMAYAMFINLLFYVFDDVPLQGQYWILFVGQFVAIVASQLLAIFFVGVTSNMRLALSLVSGYSMMSITFSGLTFPLGAMPRAAQILASIFPFTWWEKLFISQSLRGGPLAEALPYVCYLFIFQFFGLLFLVPYKKHLINPDSWGKS